MRNQQQYHFPQQTTRTNILPNRWDFMAILLGFGVLAALVMGVMHMATPYHVGEATPISLNPSQLPHYALRTVLRMLIALCCSVVFSFVVGALAAKNRHAERFIIPVIDILQSIPVLGYLSILIIWFLALFPGSLLGPECASIFAIFTSQAWNMMLSFYQSLRTVPDDLIEAADMLQLSGWQKFWRIEVPFAMPSFLWNTMMSMSAGWFFVTASEAISVANQQILLPGIGSYISVAVDHADGWSIAYAIITMFIVIFGYDQILFRPLVTWSQKFRMDAETLDQNTNTRSWVLVGLTRTRFLQWVGGYLVQASDAIINVSFSKKINHDDKSALSTAWRTGIIGLWYSVLIMGLIAAGVYLFQFISKNLSLSEVLLVFKLGSFTALRVIGLIIICSAIWVPIGVWVGLRPRVAQFVQPIAQFLAAFPANLFFPVVVSGIVFFHLNVNIWVTVLMILGTQWYILFNVIAGASTIPKELYYAAQNFRVSGWLWWKKLAIPAIFPYFITGALTAAGGAWNASIVAEYASWGHTVLIADGLGAYITEYTNKGDFPRIALGIGVMCVFVMIFNRLVWRRLYQWAETRFS
jgi:NitT/TauT family transport system permease protein